MQIDRIYYPVKTLGYGSRIGIWTIGCPHGCENCSNPELWKEDSSKDVSVNDILECISKVPCADGITITGGEPFAQIHDLNKLVMGLRKLGYTDILVYSGYTLEELVCCGGLYISTLDQIGVLVDGRYVHSLNDNKSFRGSSNQRIHVIDQGLKDVYSDAENWKRESQMILYNNQIQVIGVPIKIEKS